MVVLDPLSAAKSNHSLISGNKKILNTGLN